MFDSQKSDPSKNPTGEDDDSVVPKDYLKFDKGGVLKVEGFYVNKLAHIKGILIFD
jgi:hypothetical protein